MMITGGSPATRRRRWREGAHLKLLYVIDGLEMSGGAEQALASLAPEYRSSGIDLEVAFFGKNAGLAETLVGAGATVRRIDGRSRLERLRALARVGREGRFDLVHTTLFEADIIGRPAARLAGVPVVSSLVSVPYGKEHAADPGIKRWRLLAAQGLDAATCRLASRFHAISSDVAEVMSGRLLIQREKIDVIPRGRDSSKLGKRTASRREASRHILRVSAEERLLLAVGRHEFPKGLDVLLRSVRDLLPQQPHLRVLIAGRQGNESGRLRGLASTLGLNDVVTFLGRRDDVADLLVAADAMVFPSRREGLGSALLEAMALETPIISSDLPCVREMLADQVSALLVAPDDPRLLAAAIHKTLNHPRATERRAQAARAVFVSRYELAPVAKKMVSFYEGTLDQRRGGRQAPHDASFLLGRPRSGTAMQTTTPE